MMFDSETRWFIRCDTCPDETFGGGAPNRSEPAYTAAWAVDIAQRRGWEIHDGLHRCPWCIREGRTEIVK